MSERKEPDLGRFEDLGARDRIPTLTEIAAPDGGAPSGDAAARENEPLSLDGQWIRHEEPAGVRTSDPAPGAPTIDEADIEAAADRILDQIAPVLRERIAEALAELLGAARHDRF